MADTDTAKAPTVAIGYTHAPTFTWWLDENETTPELQFPQSVRVFDSMRRTDSQVTSVLQAVCLPVERTPWRIDPNGARDEVVQFVADDFGLPIAGQTEVRTPLRTKNRFSWTEHLRLALLMLPYGFSYFEQLYRVDDDGSRAHLAKLEFRPQMTIDRVEVATDGGLVYVQQCWTAQNSSPRPIPVDRLVAYVHRREGGNWLGQSILRPVYKNWLLKDRLLRVQAQTIERNGMGIPVYKGQDGATETDLAKGKAMATAWRSGEAAGSAVPFGADIELKGVSGTLPDAKPAVEYHDTQIARAVLAHFLNLGTQTGSWALGSTFADFFTLSLQTLAQQIASTTTQHVIEDLVDVNWGPGEPAPRLCFDEIGSRQAATAEALKSLVDAGILHPDEPLEGATRQFYGLPPADPATATPPPGGAPTATPDAPTQTGEYSVAASAGVDLDDEASWVAAAAGVDTHPGGEQLKHYWLFGEGAAKWATWTELFDHLKKYIANRLLLKATVSKWYRLRYGHNPPRHHVAASAQSGSDEAMLAYAEEFGEPDDGDDWDFQLDALHAALDELSGAVTAKFDPAAHPRNPKGGPGGGRFRSTVDRLKDALTEHRKSGGKSGDPFEGFDREQLRRAAVKQGISLERKESRDSIAKKLTDHLDDGRPGGAGPKAPSSRASGKDLVGSGGVPVADAAKALRGSSDFGEDPALAMISRRQGFDGLPEVTTAAGLDERIGAGAVELWRGVGPVGNLSAEQVAELFRTGALFHGRGRAGSGATTTTSRDLGELYAGVDGGLLRMALPPDARVIGTDDLDEIIRRESPGWDADAKLVYSDHGRLAAALGYDAIKVRGDHGLSPTAKKISRGSDQYVILNRTAVVVGPESVPPPSSQPNRRADKMADRQSKAGQKAAGVGVRKPSKSAEARRKRIEDATNAALDELDRKQRAEGRDITDGIDFAGLPAAYNPKTHENDALKEILRQQGFDGRPQVVSAAEFDAAVGRGEVRETWRGIATPVGRIPADLAEQYRTGELYVGQGINGDGVYVALGKADAEYYGSTLLRIGLRKDARVISADDLDAEMDAFFASAAGRKSAELAALDEKLLRDLAAAKTARARANIRRKYRSDVDGLDPDRSIAMQRDPGIFAALRGYDAIEIPKDRSPDKHHEMILLNRTAAIVQGA